MERDRRRAGRRGEYHDPLCARRKRDAGGAAHGEWRGEAREIRAHRKCNDLGDDDRFCPRECGRGEHHHARDGWRGHRPRGRNHRLATCAGEGADTRLLGWISKHGAAHRHGRVAVDLGAAASGWAAAARRVLGEPGGVARALDRRPRARVAARAVQAALHLRVGDAGGVSAHRYRARHERRRQRHERHHPGHQSAPRVGLFAARHLDRLPHVCVAGIDALSPRVARRGFLHRALRKLGDDDEHAPRSGDERPHDLRLVPAVCGKARADLSGHPRDGHGLAGLFQLGQQAGARRWQQCLRGVGETGAPRRECGGVLERDGRVVEIARAGGRDAAVTGARGPRGDEQKQRAARDGGVQLGAGL